MQRRLAAIVMADMVGYSRLIERDEVGTVERLKADRQSLIDPAVAAHGGHIVRLAGDGALVEFPSVVEAVQCALDIQRGMPKRNTGRTDEQRIVFRMGVNLGDIMVEEDNLHGEGINVAARLESLAEPGEILVSERVAEMVQGSIDGRAEFVEERTVKNIERPVRVWRIDPFEATAKLDNVTVPVATPGRRRWRYALALAGVLAAAVAGLLWHQPWVPRVEAARVENMAFPLPERPSVAVLPFDNLSGDDAQEFFSDGLTDNIITALSQLPEVFVIARNSTFTYKGTPVKIQQVAEDLGVRYVLQGSYQRAADRIRINAQFIDALNGRHLWAERVDRDWSDLFTVQDEITGRIVSSLSLALSEDQQLRMARRYTDNLDAFGLFLQGREIYIRYTKEDNENARELYQKAIALDPVFARAYGGLALTHNEDFRNAWTTDPKASQGVALRLARRAVELDPTLPNAYLVLADVSEMIDTEGAIDAARMAIELEPNSGDGHALLGAAQTWLGQAREARHNADIALRLNPLAVSGYHRVRGWALYFEGRYADAVDSLRKALEMNPTHRRGRLYLAAALAKLGRHDDAEWEVSQLLFQTPGLSLAGVLDAAREYIRDRDYLKNFEDGLRLAGLPERAPVQVPEKPSIAILPFDNLSADPEQEYFSDGIAEDIITDLSRLANLVVIAPHSSFSYKGENVKAQEVGRDLGVAFVLEGSVRKAGNRVRISARLVASATGDHLWAERYDRELEDIFSLQDEITRLIVSSLSVQIAGGEESRYIRHETDSFQAYDVFLEGRRYFNSFTPESFERARTAFREAIELDPEFARAYGALAVTLVREIPLGWSLSPSESLTRALDLVQTAIDMDPESPQILWALGYVKLYQKAYSEAIDAVNRAVELAPNFADGYGLLALISNETGQAADAIRYVEKGMQLNPHYSWEYPYHRGRAHYMLGEYKSAVENLVDALERNASSVLPRLYLAASYVRLGGHDDAEWQVMQLAVGNPEITLSHLERSLPISNSGAKARLIADLHQAGMTD